MQWIGSGISFLGVKPNQPVTVFVVSRAIVFSPEADAQVDMSGIRVTVEKGGYKDLGASGTVTLTSNSTLIVQGERERGSDYTLIGGAAAVAVAAVAASALFILRKRGKS